MEYDTEFSEESISKIYLFIGIIILLINGALFTRDICLQNNFIATEAVLYDKNIKETANGEFEIYIYKYTINNKTYIHKTMNKNKDIITLYLNPKDYSQSKETCSITWYIITNVISTTLLFFGINKKKYSI